MRNIATPTVIVKRRGKPDSLLVRKTKIIIVSGSRQGEEVVIAKDRVTIGASRHNDLVLADPAVSRSHCEIQLLPTGYLIRDLNSTNGTFVRGVRVAEAYLEQGAELRLGTTTLLFCPLQDVTEYVLSNSEGFGRLLGRSIAMRKIFYLAERYAPTDTTILLEGPTGAGKDLLAEEIHRHSRRSKEPFVVVDCGSLAPGIIESELFGHTRGAFTGASTDRRGAFEAAAGGTLFIDEIGTLAVDLQPKLLRAIEAKEIRPLGSNAVRKADVRIICATNVPLAEAVNAGRFREDLYFRISVVRIHLPPLRERKDDIPLLVSAFLRQLKGDTESISADTIERAVASLQTYDWPGNVRELRNFIEAAIHAPDALNDPGGHLYLTRTGGALKQAASPADGLPFKEAKSQIVGDFERKYLADLLEKSSWNVSAAAREAGIERAYMIRLLKKHDLQR